MFCLISISPKIIKIFYQRTIGSNIQILKFRNWKAFEYFNYGRNYFLEFSVLIISIKQLMISIISLSSINYTN